MTRISPWIWYGVLLLVGAVLFILSRTFPANLPFFLPWEFHWVEFLATALTLAWFWRGLQILPNGLWPSLWRRICFVAGILSFYIVLQTHVDYYAQHLFFAHRWAHFVLHHAGAFLIALGMSGPVLYAGMPDFLKPLVTARALRSVLNVLQHPAIAPVLFVGLLYFWLIPAIHTRVMLDENLYMLMELDHGDQRGDVLVAGAGFPAQATGASFALGPGNDDPSDRIAADGSGRDPVSFHDRLLSCLQYLRPGVGHDRAQRPALWRADHLVAGNAD